MFWRFTLSGSTARLHQTGPPSSNNLFYRPQTASRQRHRHHNHRLRRPVVLNKSSCRCGGLRISIKYIGAVNGRRGQEPACSRRLCVKPANRGSPRHSPAPNVSQCRTQFVEQWEVVLDEGRHLARAVNRITCEIPRYFV